MSQAVQLAEEIGHPLLEEWRKGLTAVHAKLKRRQGQSPVIARGNSGQTHGSAPTHRHRMTSLQR